MRTVAAKMHHLLCGQTFVWRQRSTPLETGMECTLIGYNHTMPAEERKLRWIKQMLLNST